MVMWPNLNYEQNKTEQNKTNKALTVTQSIPEALVSSQNSLDGLLLRYFCFLEGPNLLNLQP